MKKIMKFIPAVLAAAALASCSNDDLLVIENGSQTADNAGLAKNVTVAKPVIEDFNGVTRAGYTMDFDQLYFQKEDSMRVYDDNLVYYDVYQFTETSTGNAFVTKSDFATPAYALFPAQNVSYGAWANDGGNKALKALITIPHELTINSKSQWYEGSVKAYTTFLPLAGVATPGGEYGMSTDLEYMTSGMIIILDNTKDVVKAVKITCDADHYLSGAFEANLYDFEKGKVPTLVKGHQAVDETLDNTLIINVENVSELGNRYVVTVPVVEGDYHSIKVEAIKYAGDPDVIVEKTCTDHGDASKHKPISLKRGNLVRFQYNADIAVSTPKGLSDILESKQELTKNVTLTVAEDRTFKVSTANDGTGDQLWTIRVPEMKADNVIINIPQGIENSIEGQKLVIKDADPDNTYDKNVILNLGTFKNTTDLSNQEGNNKAIDKEGIEIDLKGANVTLAGYYTQPIVVKNAKSISFGDGTTPTRVTWENSVEYTNVAKSITIAENTLYDIPLDLSTKSFAGKDKGFEVTIDGLIRRDATTGVVNANYADVTIGGGKYAQTLNCVQVPVLNVRGDVTVEQSFTSSTQVAVSTLNILGHTADTWSQTLDLKCGYITTVRSAKINDGTLTAGSTDKKMTLTIKNDETGATGIGKLTGVDNTTEKMKVNDYTSKWFGKTLNCPRTTEDGTIYTASQLAGRCAESQATNGYTLYADMNLNSKEWTGQPLTKVFDGNSKTIEKVNLKSEKNKTAPIGLFSTLAENTNVSNVTVDGVTYTQGTNKSGEVYPNANIGAIAGKATGSMKINNVTVKDVTIVGNNKNLESIGGLVGAHTGNCSTLAISRSIVTGVSITGAYHSLGGLVGSVTSSDANANAATTINLYRNTVSVTEFGVSKTLEGNAESDINFGKVGILVGHAGTKTAVVSENDEAGAGEFDAAALHFGDHKVYWKNDSEQTVSKSFYGDKKHLIGFSAKDVTLKVDDKDYTNNYNGEDDEPGTEKEGYNFNAFE